MVVTEDGSGGFLSVFQERCEHSLHPGKLIPYSIPGSVGSGWPMCCVIVDASLNNVSICGSS